jgi:hypothetical protein
VNRLTDTPVVPLKDNALKTVRNEVRSSWLNLWRTDGRGDYAINVCAPHTLRFIDRSDGSLVKDLELDPTTWLPGRDGDLCKTKGKALAGNYTETVDSMVVDGIKVPRRILNYHGGHRGAEIDTVSAAFDTGLKPKDLAR